MEWLGGKVRSGVIQSRNYAVKDISFGDEARAAMLAGVNELAEAVKVTMGPKVTFFYILFYAEHLLQMVTLYVWFN